MLSFAGNLPPLSAAWLSTFSSMLVGCLFVCLFACLLSSLLFVACVVCLFVCPLSLVFVVAGDDDNVAVCLIFCCC